MSQADLRDRALLPVLIPVLAILVTEVVVFSMSRVLLAAGETPAVGIALATAVAILVGAAMMAARPRLRTSTITGVLVLALLATVGAGAMAARQGPAYEREAKEHLPKLTVGAADLKFDTDELKLSPMGAEIHLVNDDTQPHNIAIYPGSDQLNSPLFKGEIITAGAETTYHVEEIKVGKYYFQIGRAHV